MRGGLLWVVVVAVVGLAVCPAVRAEAATAGKESASVLLEKGIYLEETAGDLDAAIATYRQVVEQAQANRRFAAEAQYRLGACLLKKGKDTEAIVALQKVVDLYPEQKSLVERARGQIRQARQGLGGEAVAKVVQDAVTTISTCAEGDPRVAQALATLDGLDEPAVVTQLANHLDSDIANVRRSAVYILWKGGFASIEPAAPGLVRLLGHEEEFTRGMAAIALGANRAEPSFDAITKMTLEDRSGYARRCAAYALGLMGLEKARPVLAKALKDTDAMVRANAQAASQMLATSASSKPAGGNGAGDPAVDVAKAWLEAVEAGQFERALGLSRPGEFEPDKLRKMNETFDFSRMRLIQAFRAAQAAAVLFGPFTDKQRAKPPADIGVGLVRQGDRWIVRDLDFLPTAEAREKWLTEFHAAYPDAKPAGVERLPEEVMDYIIAEQLKTYGQAMQQHLHANCHIYGVDDAFNLYFGGLLAYRNAGDSPQAGPIHLGNFSPRPDHVLVDEAGREQRYEVRENFGPALGKYGLYWYPDQPVEPGVSRLLGYIRSPVPLPQVDGQAQLTMDNHFGSPVLENFFLVVPRGMPIVEQSEPPKSSTTVGAFDIYLWQQDVPANTTHQVRVRLGAVPAAASQPTATQKAAAGTPDLVGRSYHATAEAFLKAIASDQIDRALALAAPGALEAEELRKLGHGLDVSRMRPVQTWGSAENGCEVYGQIRTAKGDETGIGVGMVAQGGRILVREVKLVGTRQDIRKFEVPYRESYERLHGASKTSTTAASSAPAPGRGELQIQPAPWSDGEEMRLAVQTKLGMDIGTMIYTARKVRPVPKAAATGSATQPSAAEALRGRRVPADTAGQPPESLWRIESYMAVPITDSRQYTRVDARLASFEPASAVTKNQLGTFEAVYERKQVLLTITQKGQSSMKLVDVTGPVFDNEQALYLIRRLPLADGYEGSFSIFPVVSGAVTTCKVRVEGRETVQWAKGQSECFHVRLEVLDMGIAALRHQLWISTDPHRALVKYDADQVMMVLQDVGRVATEPVKWQAADNVWLARPVGWQFIRSAAPSPYRLMVSILPPEMTAWALFTAAELPMDIPARAVAEGDVETLKGFFKDYTVRPDSWQDRQVSGIPGVSYVADYKDESGEMVEYRAYFTGPGTVYWFVFRVDKEAFAAAKSGYDAVIQGLQAPRPTETQKAAAASRSAAAEPGGR